MATQVAKLFKTGGSQAVRLPAEFRFEGDEVFIFHNESGDVVLSKNPGVGIEKFLKFAEQIWRDYPETREPIERNQPEVDSKNPFEKYGW